MRFLLPPVSRRARPCQPAVTGHRETTAARDGTRTRDRRGHRPPGPDGARRAHPVRTGRARPERVSCTADDGTLRVPCRSARTVHHDGIEGPLRDAAYGQKLPAPSGFVLDVGPGRVLERMDVALPRAAAITGRVIDDLGDPLNVRR